MLVYQKIIFDRYYCIKSFCHLKILRKLSSKSSFLYCFSGAQRHERFVDFENACFKVTTYVILTSFRCTLLLMASNFAMV